MRMEFIHFHLKLFHQIAAETLLLTAGTIGESDLAG